MGGYYNENELIEIIDDFTSKYKAMDSIPYKKHLQQKLGVTKITLARYAKKYPKAFEHMNLTAKQMIVRHALQGKMKHDKALFLLIKNYDNESIGGIVANQIRFSKRFELRDILISYGRAIGLQITEL